MFLKRPLPSNLPTVNTCGGCNNSYSSDEDFVATSIEIYSVGGFEFEDQFSSRVKNSLMRSPRLRQKIYQQFQKSLFGEIRLEFDRVKFERVFRKMGLAHHKYELGYERTGNRDVEVRIHFIADLDEDARLHFETPAFDNLLPEVNSRSFISSATLGSEPFRIWWDVQEDLYRYTVSEGCVRMIVRECIAVEVLC